MADLDPPSIISNMVISSSEEDDVRQLIDSMPSEERYRKRLSFVYVVLASSVAALGGILFGYDTGIISGALLPLTEQFHLDCAQQSLLVSSMLIGAVIASAVGGFIVDSVGRKLAIVFNAIIFILSAIVLAASTSYAILANPVNTWSFMGEGLSCILSRPSPPVFTVALICTPNFKHLKKAHDWPSPEDVRMTESSFRQVMGRIAVGFAVSLSATAECIYISEIAPARWRGSLVSLNELFITVGFLMAYLMNYTLLPYENGWRWMFALAIFPAFIQMVAMIFLPFSPRFLLIKAKEEKAEATLQKLRGTDVVEHEMSTIKQSLFEEKGTNCCDICAPTENMPQRMFIGMSVVFFQQFTGQTTVLYFAPTIFVAVGFESDSAATLASVGLGAIKVLFTVVTICLVDRGGRRKFLLCGASLMAVSILTLAFVTAAYSDELVDVCSETAQNLTSTEVVATSAPHNTTQENIDSLAESGNGKYIALVSLMVYISGYSVGFGPVSWLILSEIFPSKVKGRAVSIASVCNWGANLIITWTFLDMMGALGTSETFLIYGIICLLSAIFVFFCVPETKGRSLEQISNELKSGTICIGLAYSKDCCGHLYGACGVPSDGPSQNSCALQEPRPSDRESLQLLSVNPPPTSYKSQTSGNR